MSTAQLVLSALILINSILSFGAFLLVFVALSVEAYFMVKITQTINNITTTLDRIEWRS